MKIETLTSESASRCLPELVALLSDAVKHGASVGFVAPLGVDEASAYWRGIIDDLGGETRVLFGAFDDGNRLIGSAQLALERRANGRHRAEVQKVLVLASARRCGIGAALMARIEAEAAARRRTLLFLDTSSGAGGATSFYDALGYRLVGSIPDYAADPDGRLVANAIYYRQLPAATGG